MNFLLAWHRKLIITTEFLWKIVLKFQAVDLQACLWLIRHYLLNSPLRLGLCFGSLKFALVWFHESRNKNLSGLFIFYFLNDPREARWRNRDRELSAAECVVEADAVDNQILSLGFSLCSMEAGTLQSHHSLQSGCALDHLGSHSSGLGLFSS